MSIEHGELRAAVATCMDFRFQELIDSWIKENNLYGQHDRIAVAGAAGDLESVYPQIELSIKLHGTIEVHVINHQNCGYYGNSVDSGSTAEHKKHSEDLGILRSKIQDQFPEVKFFGYFATLDEEGKAKSIEAVEIS